MIPPPSIMPQVSALNQNALAAAREMLQFNQSVLDDVLACRVFTVIYPNELEHLVNEAQDYITMLTRLVSGAEEMAPREFAMQQAFWNENMGQHAEYIEGSLDLPVLVKIDCSDRWTGIATGLDPVFGTSREFTAPDFDILYDCPLLIGELEELP